MAGLSRAQQTAIDRLIAASPDTVLTRLGAVLSRTDGDRVRAVASQIAEEMAERRVRAAVFGPALHLVSPRGPTSGPRFPPALAIAAWRAAAEREPELARQAAEYDPPVALLNRLTLTVAGVLRDQGATLAPGLEPGQAEAFAHYVDLIPLVRPVARLMTAWTHGLTEDEAARLRLILGDAAAVASEGDLRVLEMLAASLEEPTAILRIIARAVHSGASERMLARSELSAFGDRAVAAIGRAVEQVEAVNVKAIMPMDSVEIGDALDLAGRLIIEMTTSVEMCDGEPWSAQILKFTRRLNAAAEGLLSHCEKGIDRAVPLERTTIAGRMTRRAPALDWPESTTEVERAQAFASLLGRTRASAPLFGFASRRTKVLDAVIDRLTSYVEEALDALGGDEATDTRNALRLIALAIDLLAHAGETQTAAAFGRRLSLAEHAPSQAVG